MAITRYNLIKWTKMILGISKLHVNQNIGKFIVPEKISGYYNDLREKVLCEKNLLTNQVPITTIEDGSRVYFPTAIFQYGLGAYDMYLETHDDNYKNRFYTAVKWAIENQKLDGSWENFYFSQPDHPFSCMSQGEGASLLIRAFVEYSNDKYLLAANKAIDFMLSSTKKTISFDNLDLIFLEYTNKSPVLNGWIFAIFGLYDFMLISKEDKYINIFEESVQSLKKYLNDFDMRYWSSYNMNNSIISSRFYHKLHIALLDAMYIITKDDLFKEYYLKFRKYDNKISYRIRAFTVKVIQKIKE